MINKVTQIRKLLEQGKTTREIAHELRVSLRDIGLVRKQEGIDIGALERKKISVEQDIINLDNSIAFKHRVIDQLEQQINDLQRAKMSIEATIQRKQTEVKYVRQPVKPIYFPQNYDEVKKYLETLSLDQLISLSQIMTNIFSDRLVRSIDADNAKLLKEVQDNINRMRNSL